ncbi:hypothetical protein D3C71_1910130 [compost metagenome]
MFTIGTIRLSILMTVSVHAQYATMLLSLLEKCNKCAYNLVWIRIVNSFFLPDTVRLQTHPSWNDSDMKRHLLRLHIFHDCS